MRYHIATHNMYGVSSDQTKKNFSLILFIRDH